MTMGRRRRRVVVLAGLVALFCGGTGRTAAQEAAGYEYFSASAVGDGVTALYEIINLLPINRPVDVSTVTSEARFETTRSTGLAVLPYPGDAVLNVPGTAAGFTGQSLPGYPLVARADHPTQPKEEVGPGAGVPGVSAARLVAEADGTASSGEAAVSGLASAGLFSTGSVRTTAASRATSSTGFGARATSTLGDVDLAGGVVHIDSITAVVEVAFGDGKATVKENRITVQGVTVAGQPARVTNDGLELAGAPQSLGLGDALELAPGLTVRTTEGSTVERESGLTARSGSLVVTYETILQGAPSRARLVLGEAEATIEARGPIDDAVTPSEPGTSIDPAVVDAVSQGTTGLAALPPRPGPGGLPAAAPTRTPLRTAPVGLVDAIDFRPVYAWLALAGLSVAYSRRWVATRAATQRTAPSDLRPLWRW